MTTIKSFVERLKKLGIDVELSSNYPWLYLDKVNGKRVKGTYEAEHGFTIFFRATKKDQVDKLLDTKIIFDKIRETLNS